MPLKSTGSMTAPATFPHHDRSARTVRTPETAHAMSADTTDTSSLHFDDAGVFKTLCGEHNRHVSLICRQLQVTIKTRGTTATISGAAEAQQQARRLLQELYFIVEAGHYLEAVDIISAARMIRAGLTLPLQDIFLDTVIMSAQKRPITPKTMAQKCYVDAIRNNDIVFGIGPAGTGKTYLAMAMAIAAFTRREVTRIILTRPAVEAGERLGFLPGDMLEKVNPYLRPLYDALHDIMDMHRASELLHQGIIEVAPIAFMRGRTLNDSFVILDEAQNCTSEQMKMFLTRLGFHSRAVITGDITQIDLPRETLSGLVEAQQVLQGVSGLAFTAFTEMDVVRHPLVESIISAYGRASQAAH